MEAHSSQRGGPTTNCVPAGVGPSAFIYCKCCLAMMDHTVRANGCATRAESWCEVSCAVDMGASGCDVQPHGAPGSAKPGTQPVPPCPEGPCGPRIVPLARDLWATSSPRWGPPDGMGYVATLITPPTLLLYNWGFKNTHISRGHSLHANVVGFGTFPQFSEILVRCAEISFPWVDCVYNL